MLPVCAPEMEVQPDFKVDCPAKFRSCNSFLTQLVKAPTMPILLPRCYICPSGSVNMTLSACMSHRRCSNENVEHRKSKRSHLMLAERIRVMAAIGKDGVLCSGSEPAIDQRRRRGSLLLP